MKTFSLSEITRAVGHIFDTTTRSEKIHIRRQKNKLNVSKLWLHTHQSKMYATRNTLACYSWSCDYSLIKTVFCLRIKTKKTPVL
jgi:hypothetical protein